MRRLLLLLLAFSPLALSQSPYDNQMPSAPSPNDSFRQGVNIPADSWTCSSVNTLSDSLANAQAACDVANVAVTGYCSVSHNVYGSRTCNDEEITSYEVWRHYDTCPENFVPFSADQSVCVPFLDGDDTCPAGFYPNTLFGSSSECAPVIAEEDCWTDSWASFESSNTVACGSVPADDDGDGDTNDELQETCDSLGLSDVTCTLPSDNQQSCEDLGGAFGQFNGVDICALSGDGSGSGSGSGSGGASGEGAGDGTGTGSGDPGTGNGSSSDPGWSPSAANGSDGCGTFPTCADEDGVLCALLLQNYYMRCEATSVTMFCESPFVCEGDAMECVLAELDYNDLCMDPDEFKTDLENAFINEGFDNVDDIESDLEGQGYTRSEEIDFSQDIGDWTATASSGGGSCPADIPIDVGAFGSVSVPLSDYCDLIRWLGDFVRISAAWIATLMVFNTVRGAFA